MGKNYNGSPGGSDAATIKPKMIADENLLGRDDSGGPDYDPHTAEFADTFIKGPKAHLSASGGGSNGSQGDEISHMDRQKGARKAAGN